MKLQGKPDLVVTMLVRRFGKLRPVQLFKFDSKGFAEFDETKLSGADKSRLMAKFKVVDSVKKVDKVEVMDDDIIRQLAKDKGIKSWHVKSIAKLKEELGV
jgi:hypothetical protein